MPYQANSETACGANASAFGPNAVVPPFPFRFLQQLLIARFMDFSPADIAPPAPGLTSSFAVASRRQVKASSPEGSRAVAADGIELVVLLCRR